MRRGLAPPLFFLGFCLGLAGMLRLCRDLPQALDPRAPRSFSTLEDAARALHPFAPRLPRYLPEVLDWPPAEVVAAAGPEPWIVVHVNERATGELVLALRQGTAAPPARLDPHTELRRSTADLFGATALVVLALCADGEPCNRVQWTQNGVPVDLVGRLPVDELIRVAHGLAGP